MARSILMLRVQICSSLELSSLTYSLCLCDMCNSHAQNGCFLLVPHLKSSGEPRAHQKLDLALTFDCEKVESAGERTELISSTAIPSGRLLLLR